MGRKPYLCGITRETIVAWTQPVPALRFCRLPSDSCLYALNIAVTADEGNPFRWPAVVILLWPLNEGIPARGVHASISYSDLRPLVLRCLSSLIELRDLAITGLPRYLSDDQVKELYPEYYGASIDGIASKFLELARAVPADGYAAGPPPFDIYLWLSPRSKGPAQPVRASELLSRPQGLDGRLGPFTEIVVPLLNPAGLQDLLRLGHLSIYSEIEDIAEPSEGRHQVKAEVIVNTAVYKRLKLRYPARFGLAVAMLALLGQPLAETYKALEARRLP
jgi:hypothetical protein